jgi:hypothetical protein
MLYSPLPYPFISALWTIVLSSGLRRTKYHRTKLKYPQILINYDGLVFLLAIFSRFIVVQ